MMTREGEMATMIEDVYQALRTSEKDKIDGLSQNSRVAETSDQDPRRLPPEKRASQQDTSDE
jgi:hypothetical protein